LPGSADKRHIQTAVTTDHHLGFNLFFTPHKNGDAQNIIHTQPVIRIIGFCLAESRADRDTEDENKGKMQTTKMQTTGTAIT